MDRQHVYLAISPFICLVLACSLLLAIALLIYNRYLVKRRFTRILLQRNEIIARQNRRIDEMNQELKMKILQSRLNPHFLFNSLNSIQYFVSVNEKAEAQQYISHFSTFIRLVLLHGDELLTGVQQEAMLVEQYLWLEQRRFPGRFSYGVSVSPEAQLYDLPPLLVHGVLEKVIYNNILGSTTQQLQLHVHFEPGGEQLLIRVEDNGQPAEGAASQRTGLAGSESGHILEKRLQLINRAAVVPIQMSSGRTSTGNVTTLVIPQPLFN